MVIVMSINQAITVNLGKQWCLLCLSTKQQWLLCLPTKQGWPTTTTTMITTNANNIPDIPKSLLECLENRFSSKIPTSKNFSYEDFRYLQGQVSVVEFLRHQFTLQTQTVMENA